MATKKTATKAPAKKPAVKTKAPAKKSTAKAAAATDKKLRRTYQAQAKEAASDKRKFGPIKFIEDFFHMEAAGGIILLCFAVAAMIIANSQFGELYYYIFHDVKLNISVGPFEVHKDLIHWINDGLMAIFFFLVGLEIKREFMEGALSTRDKAILPAIAAVGGMVVPALFYVALNYQNPEAMAGWAVPMATDIAFALGVVTLLGKRVPLALKVFLLAVAIFDDLGAIIVIAMFYTANLQVESLYWAGFFLALLIGANRLKISSGSIYVALGICMWFCVLKSGVHATLAGVLTALAIPLSIPGERRSLLKKLEHDLHGLVAFIILPVFAFANAGVSLEGMSFEILVDEVTLGVILGLVLGKQLGVFAFTYGAVKTGLAKLPQGVTWLQVWGVSALTGIGFTMSLFIASLGFRANPLYLSEAKLGILVGSLISAVVGTIILLRCKGKGTK